MRHYCNKLPNGQLISISTHMLQQHGAQRQLTEDGLSVLNPYLDGETPASHRVRLEFEEWIAELVNYYAPPPFKAVDTAAMKRKMYDSDVPNCSFLYANLNEGKSVVFIVTLPYGEGVVGCKW